MKKNRLSKIIVALIAITMTFICASCSHEAAVNDCFLSVSAADASRSVLPYFDLNDMTFILKGKLNGGEEQTLVIYYSYQAMVKDKLAIEKGSWEFTLYASTATEYHYDLPTPAGTVLSGTASKEIKKGLNSISFALVLQERDPHAYPSQNNGIVDIQIKLPETYNVYVKATVTPINGTTSEEYTLQPVNHSVAFKKDDFSNGFFNITFDFYKDADCLVKIFSHQETVETLEGCTSKATLDFENLNPKMHAITYNLNGGSYASGYKAPASYESVWGTTLPNALQVTKSGGYVLAGWYDTPNFTGNRYDVMRGLESNMTLYAKWVQGIIVTKETVSSLDLSTYTEPLTLVYVGSLDDTVKEKIQKSPVSIDLILSDIGTEIGDDAFRNCRALTSITIPEGVTSIGYGAFEGCSSLTDLHVADLKSYLSISMGDSYSQPFYSTDSSKTCRVFVGNTEVTSIVIPERVVSIPKYTFRNCKNITSVTIPEGATSIGSGAFYGCSALTSITIPEGVTSIGDSAFRGCSALTSVVIPAGVTSISNQAFCRCSALTSITIPKGVTSIGDSAFSFCSALTSVVIPKGVTFIDDQAFCDCSALSSVTIPEGVTEISYGAFAGCSKLTSVTIPEGVTSIGGLAFEYCSSLTSITIPAGVTSIGDQAFYYCSALTSVTIPEGVTEIGEGAFEKCSSLTSVTVPSGYTVPDGVFPSSVTITRN